MCARCVNHNTVIQTFFFRVTLHSLSPLIVLRDGEMPGRGQLGTLSIKPHFAALVSSRSLIALCEPLALGLVRPGHPAPPVRMPPALKPAALAPQMEG